MSPASSASAPPAIKQPRGEHEWRDPSGRRARRDDTRLAPAQALPRLRHQEHRVIGDDAQQQHRQHRLDLAGHRHARAFTGPREHAHRDHVREPGGRERHQRGSQRPEVHGDDDEDHHDRGDLDPRQDAVDLAELREAGRAGARDRARLARLRVRQLGRVPMRDALALEQVEVGIEEQVRQHRRAVLTPADTRDRRVDDRQRHAHPLQLAPRPDRAKPPAPGARGRPTAGASTPVGLRSTRRVSVETVEPNSSRARCWAATAFDCAGMMSSSGAELDPPSHGSRTSDAINAAIQASTIGTRSATIAHAYARATRPLTTGADMSVHVPRANAYQLRPGSLTDAPSSARDTRSTRT